MTSCSEPAAEPLPTTPGGFACVLADPPWSFRSWSDKGKNRAPDAMVRQKGLAERHYATMSLADIKALPVADVAAKDAILLLWTVDCMLHDALAVGAAWGFTFKTVAFTWAKLTRAWDEDSGTIPASTDPRDERGFWHIGLGYWTRGNPEQCLLFTRGHPRRQSASVRQLIVAPRREHSRKPDEQYERIEALCSGPRLELFARHRRPGWISWGNQLPPYDPVANGLNTYALACQLAREGHAGVREWFSEQGRPGSGAEEAQSPADLGRRGVAPARVTTKPAQSDDYGEFQVEMFSAVA